MSEEIDRLKEAVDGRGEVIIKDGEEEIRFTCKANRWTDLVLAESGPQVYDVFQGGGDNQGLAACYKLISAMSRNGSDTGKPLLTAEEAEEKVDSFTFRGCLIVALSRYSDMLEELSEIATTPDKKKAE